MVQKGIEVSGSSGICSDRVSVVTMTKAGVDDIEGRNSGIGSGRCTDSVAYRAHRENADMARASPNCCFLRMDCQKPGEYSPALVVASDHDQDIRSQLIEEKEEKIKSESQTGEEGKSDVKRVSDVNKGACLPYRMYRIPMVFLRTLPIELEFKVMNDIFHTRYGGTIRE